MAKHRESLPEDLKELITLCRQGKLFAVQDWVKSGMRYQPPSGNFITSPFRTAIDLGFHSLVEVFLRAGIEQNERDIALTRAVEHSRLDLVELLASYGADIRQVCRETVIRKQDSEILQWFIARGMDLEEGDLIVRAFRRENRVFLRVFRDIRDKLPSAPRQAAMALRLHTQEGSIRMVSLLIWAGADPRLSVPDPKYPDLGESLGTALEDAICYGQSKIVEKFRIDRSRDENLMDRSPCPFPIKIRPDAPRIQLLSYGGL
jgi:hypothetical protein